MHMHVGVSVSVRVYTDISNIYLCVYVFIYQHPRTNKMLHKVNFGWSLAGFNSAFSFP